MLEQALIGLALFVVLLVSIVIFVNKDTTKRSYKTRLNGDPFPSTQTQQTKK